MENTNFNRYLRQIAIKEIGEEGQRKICNSKVFIIGCGALGSMVAMQLAGAGVGTIGIADFDTIDETNLQRQLFFNEDDNGKNKADILEKRIREINSHVLINKFPNFITNKVAKSIFSQFEVIVDATDNPSSKYVTDTICGQLNIPCVIGGVSGFKGQVTTLLPESTRYSELFNDAEENGFLPCSLDGVIGPSAVTCASIQSMEVIKLIIGVGEVLNNKLLTFNLLDYQFRIYNY